VSGRTGQAQPGAPVLPLAHGGAEDRGPVLVAYASRHGSTEEVARFIAGVVGRHGVEVATQAAAEVRGSVAGHRLVILGGAIYSGRWHRDAHRFLKRHRDQLSRVPVAVFGMGPRELGAEAFARAEAQLVRALAKRDWLHPVATAVFGGVDPPSRRPDRRRDARDWAAIEAWASALVERADQPGPPSLPAG